MGIFTAFMAFLFWFMLGKEFGLLHKMGDGWFYFVGVIIAIIIGIIVSILSFKGGVKSYGEPTEYGGR